MSDEHHHLAALVQLILMLSARASRAYLAESSAITRAKACALPPTGSVAVCRKLSRVAGSASTLPISVFRRSTTRADVLNGTSAPYQDSSTMPLKPASSRVGTSGRLGERAGPDCARMRMLPAL